MGDGTFRPRMPGNGGRLSPCATYEDAENLLDAALAALADGSATPVGGVTLTGFGADVLDQRELRGVASHKTDRSRWRRHIATAYFAGWPLKTIARSDIIAWRDAMLAKKAAPSGGQKKLKKPRKLSRSTIQSTLNLLRVVLEEALDQELIQDNPARTVRLPSAEGRTHDPWTYLMPEEQKALLESAPEADRLLIAFAIGTGMREGEIWNLELRDVDKKAWRITVRYGSKGKATKGKRLRKIPLFGIAADAFEQWLPLLAKQENPHGLLWPLPSGARRQKGKAPKGWPDYLKAAGLVAEKRHDGRPVRFHDLRHTCASALVCGWWGRRWSLEEVKGLLGHRSITTTERYAHLADGALDVAARETYLPTITPPMSHPEHETSAPNQAETGQAPPARIGRATFGLGTLTGPENLRALGHLRGELLGLSRHGLEAILRGGPEAWRTAGETFMQIARLAEAIGVVDQARVVG